MQRPRAVPPSPARLSTRTARRTAGAATTAVWLAAAVPVAYVPGSLDRFTLPKLLMATLAVLVATAVPGAGVLPRAVVRTVAAGTMVLLLAAVTSAAPLASLAGRYPRYEGLLALPVYVGLAWAGARLLGPDAPAERRRTLVAALATASLLLGAVSAVEALGLRPLGGDVTRPGALLGNATDQGLVGAALLTVLVAAALAPRARLARAGAVAAGVAVVAAGSRAGVLAALVGIALVAWHVGRSPARTTAAWGWPMAAAGTIAVSALALPATRARVTGADALAQQTVVGRWDIWGSTLDLLATRPSLGVGPSGFLDAYPAVQSATAAATSDPLSTLDAPHAWPLQAAMAGGLPLLALALVLAAIVVSRLLSSARSTLAHGSAPAPALLLIGATGAVLGHGVALLTHPTGPGTAVVALLAGAGLAVRARPAPTTGDGASPGDGPLRTAVTGAGLWAVRVWAGLLVVALGLAIGGDRAMEVATAHAAAGEVAPAEHAFSTALLLRPWDPDVALVAALTFRGGALAGDPASADAALRWSRAGLRRTPTSTELHLVLGAAQLTLGRVPEAVTTLGAAVVLAPHNAMAHLLLGVALARDGSAAPAEEHLLVATNHPATARDAWAGLAVLYAGTGRTAAAADATARAAAAG